MTRPQRTMTRDQARAEVRRINDQGVVEALVQQSVVCEDTLWQELKGVLHAEGTTISREFRRWATARVKQSQAQPPQQE